MEKNNHDFINRMFSIKFFLILTIFFANEVNSYLEFPLEHLPNKNYKFLNDGDDISKKEKEDLMKQIYFKRLYTKFEMGNPTKSQMLIINSDSNQYYFDSLTTLENSETCEISEYYQFGEKEFYDETSSKSYEKGECQSKEHKFYDYDEICYSKDKIIFDIDGKKSTIEFPIKVIKNHDKSEPGLIGLAMNDTMSYTERSFLSELKMENLINDYYWFVDFNDFSQLKESFKGKLFVGDLPHNIYPEKYLEDYYYQTSSYRTSSIWTLDMQKIYIENKEYHLDNNQVSLFYEFYPVIGPRDFWNSIRNNFMDTLIEEGKCFSGKFSQDLYSYDDLLFYYCDKSAQDILYESLPSINFVSKSLEFTFQLTKEELFYQKGDYIYFMILFCPKQFNNWLFGQMITFKYHFVFNTDKRQIGLYHKVNIENKENIENITSKKNNLWIIIISTSLVFIVIGIILGIIIGVKFCKKKRVKRANELLDDDYEEQVKDKNIN